MKQKIIHWLKQNLGIHKIIERQEEIEEKQTEQRSDHLRLVKEVRSGQDKNKRKEGNYSRGYRTRND